MWFYIWLIWYISDKYTELVNFILLLDQSCTLKDEWYHVLKNATFKIKIILIFNNDNYLKKTSYRLYGGYEHKM